MTEQNIIWNKHIFSFIIIQPPMINLCRVVPPFFLTFPVPRFFSLSSLFQGKTIAGIENNGVNNFQLNYRTVINRIDDYNAIRNKYF